MEQRSKEWHAARVGKVTASNVGAILGLDPYRDRDDVMRAMVREAHGAEKEFTGNAATAWGTANEKHARLDYEMDTQHDTQDAPFVTHPENDWIGASPDAFVGEKGLLEIKCPYGIRNDPEPTFKTLDEQPHYAAQVQVQLYVTGREWCHFYQWTPYRQSRPEVVKPDRDWLLANLPRLKSFYDEFLRELDNPDHLSPRRVVIDTPDAHALHREYADLSDQIDNATERRKELLAAMVAMAGDRDALFAGHKLTRVEKEGSVFYAKVVKERLPGLDLTPWRGAGSSYWRVS